MSRMYGVRSVRYRPGSAEARGLSSRCRSDHSETVSAGSGSSPLRQACASSSAPSKAKSSSELRPDLGEFSEVTADMRFYKLLNRMSFDTEFCRHQRCDARRPIDPRIAFLAREAEDHCGGASAIDQLSFHAL